MLAADLPTNQSPPATSNGEPLREYGRIDELEMGHFDRIARPEPSAPLAVGSSINARVALGITHL